MQMAEHKLFNKTKVPIKIPISGQKARYFSSKIWHQISSRRLHFLFFKVIFSKNGNPFTSDTKSTGIFHYHTLFTHDQWGFPFFIGCCLFCIIYSNNQIIFGIPLSFHWTLFKLYPIYSNDLIHFGVSTSCLQKQSITVLLCSCIVY